jgi:hypothetical protein
MLIRERQRETTELLVGAFADVLQVLDRDPADIEAGPLVTQAVTRHGDVRELLASCEAISAYHGDNYLPLMWRFYRSHRSTLFRFAHTLRLVSTTQDTSVLDALEVVLANEDRTSDHLSTSVNLAFASEQWQRTVLVRTNRGRRSIRRKTNGYGAGRLNLPGGVRPALHSVRLRLPWWVPREKQ